MADAKKAELKAADKEAQAKNAALQAAVSQIEKDFGQGSVMRLGDKGHVDVDAIPTGALSLDLALGVGGVPRGRITGNACLSTAPTPVHSNTTSKYPLSAE